MRERVRACSLLGTHPLSVFITKPFGLCREQHEHQVRQRSGRVRLVLALVTSMRESLLEVTHSIYDRSMPECCVLLPGLSVLEHPVSIENHADAAKHSNLNHSRSERHVGVRSVRHVGVSAVRLLEVYYLKVKMTTSATCEQEHHQVQEHHQAVCSAL